MASKPIENPSSQGAIPDPEIPTERPSSSKGRPGAGARSRKAERSRFKQNEQFDKTLQQTLSDKFAVVKTQEVFGPRVQTLSTPPLRVELRTACYARLCHHVVQVLHGACKIQRASEIDAASACEYDYETLLYATAFQLDAKEYYATIGSFLTEMQPPDEAYVSEQVVRCLGRGILPLSVALDQIGKFTLSGHGQTFYPKISPRRSLSVKYRAGDGNVLSEYIGRVVRGRPVVLDGAPVLGADGYPLYYECSDDAARLFNLGITDAQGNLTATFIGDPNSFQWFGLVRFHVEHGHTPLTLAQVIARYLDLLARVERKLGSGALSPLSIERGLGQASQLVGCAEVEEGDLEVQAWCSRVVPDDAYMYAVALGLGTDGQGLHSRDIAVNVTTVSCSGMLVALANMLCKQLRRSL